MLTDFVHTAIIVVMTSQPFKLFSEAGSKPVIIGHTLGSGIPWSVNGDGEGANYPVDMLLPNSYCHSGNFAPFQTVLGSKIQTSDHWSPVGSGVIWPVNGVGEGVNCPVDMPLLNSSCHPAYLLQSHAHRDQPTQLFNHSQHCHSYHHSQLIDDDIRPAVQASMLAGYTGYNHDIRESIQPHTNEVTNFIGALSNENGNISATPDPPRGSTSSSKNNEIYHMAHNYDGDMNYQYHPNPTTAHSSFAKNLQEFNSSAPTSGGNDENDTDTYGGDNCYQYFPDTTTVHSGHVENLPELNSAALIFDAHSQHSFNGATTSGENHENVTENYDAVTDCKSLPDATNAQPGHTGNLPLRRRPTVGSGVKWSANGVPKCSNHRTGKPLLNPNCHLAYLLQRLSHRATPTKLSNHSQHHHFQRIDKDIGPVVQASMLAGCTGPVRTHGQHSSESTQIPLWEFFLTLLLDKTCKRFITWTGDGWEFKVKDPKEVARRWGNRRGLSTMPYKQLRNSLYYYYYRNIIHKEAGQRCVYRFVCDLRKLLGLTAEEIHTLVDLKQTKTDKEVQNGRKKKLNVTFPEIAMNITTQLKIMTKKA